MAFEQLSDKLQAVMKKVRGQSRLTEENMEEMLKEIRMSLLEADVNYKVVKEFVNNVKEKSIGQDVLKTLSPGQMILKIIKDELVALLGEENDALNISSFLKFNAKKIYDELEQIKQQFIKEVNFRKLGDTSGVDYKYDVMVCGGTGCRSCKSN